MKVVSHVFRCSDDIAERINKELEKLYEKYPNGDLFDIKCNMDQDSWVSALIIFETEKPEINPLILNQIIESLKDKLLF